MNENKGCYVDTSLGFSFISLQTDLKIIGIFPEEGVFFCAFNSYVAHVSLLGFLEVLLITYL